ncbi:MAG: conjugal transfer protein TraX [Clostridia bacterium]|nr:conjugal transfer protein TraX [Clostridia bacterium]
MEKRFSLETSTFSLRIMAMLFMLCDHLWATLIEGNEWLTCIGRLAFPIFAFMIVEGYFHTKNLKKYVLRLLIFALISEIPFNLMTGNSLIYPFHQNVLWSFLLGIFLIFLNEKTKQKGKLWLRILTAAATLILGFFLGLLTMVDYHHAGIFMLLTFYFFRGRKWWCLLGQALCMWYINFEILGGYEYILPLFDKEFHFPQQGFALLALIPIWLYKGKHGYHSKPLQYAFYAFYPAHLLILWMIGTWMK